MAWWPFGRDRPTRAGADASPGPGELGAGTPSSPPPAWTTSAPIQRVIESSPSVVDVRFGDQLASWQSPEFLAPLGHEVREDAPSGLVSGVLDPISVLEAPTTRPDEGESSRAMASTREFAPPAPSARAVPLQRATDSSTPTPTPTPAVPPAPVVRPGPGARDLTIATHEPAPLQLTASTEVVTAPVEPAAVTDRGTDAVAPMLGEMDLVTDAASRPDALLGGTEPPLPIGPTQDPTSGQPTPAGPSTPVGRSAAATPAARADADGVAPVLGQSIPPIQRSLAEGPVSPPRAGLGAPLRGPVAGPTPSSPRSPADTGSTPTPPPSAGPAATSAAPGPPPLQRSMLGPSVTRSTPVPAAPTEPGAASAPPAPRDPDPVPAAVDHTPERGTDGQDRGPDVGDPEASGGEIAEPTNPTLGLAPLLDRVQLSLPDRSPGPGGHGGPPDPPTSSSLPVVSRALAGEPSISRPLGSLGGPEGVVAGARDVSPQVATRPVMGLRPEVPIVARASLTAPMGPAGPLASFAPASSAPPPVVRLPVSSDSGPSPARTSAGPALGAMTPVMTQRAPAATGPGSSVTPGPPVSATVRAALDTGVARLEPDGSIVFGAGDEADGPAVQRSPMEFDASPMPGGTARIVQREEETSVGGEAAAGTEAAGAGSGAATPPPTAAPMSDDQVEQLARRLYPRVRDRWQSELRLDRERAGRATDLVR